MTSLPVLHNHHDRVLASRHLNAHAPWLDLAEPVSIAHVMCAARETRREPAAVGSRLTELGYRVPTAEQLAAVTDDDMKLLSRDLDGARPWIVNGPPLSVRGQVFWAARRLGRPPAEIAARFAALGVPVPGPPHFPATVDDYDLKLISQDTEGAPDWIGLGDAPRLRGHVLRAALRLGWSPARAAARLAGLGFPGPRERLPATVDDDDLLLVSGRLFSGWPPMDEDDVPRMRGRVLWGAERLGRPPAEIASRFAELGYRTPAADTFPERVEPDDRHLTSSRSDDHTYWIPDDDLVPLAHVLTVLPHIGDASKAPAETASAVAALCGRYARLGYRVHPGAAEATADDLVLVSAGLDGHAPWLDPEQPVPLAHVLRFAHAHGRVPAEVVARLDRLGYHRLPEDAPSGSVDAEAVALLGHAWGERPWLDQDDPEWFPHLVAVGARTGRALAEAADRLRELGFRIPEEELPDRTTEEDLRLISRQVVTAGPPWLSRTDPVPAGHVLWSAHARGSSVAPVLARLRELGCTRLPDVPDTVVTDDDLRLVSEQGDGRLPVLADTVPYGRVVQAAVATGAGLRETAERYRELGHTDVVLPAGPLPESVTGDDVELLRTDTGWLAPDAAVPPPHVVRLAHAAGTSPAGIGRRLRALGFHGVPAALPDTPFAGDLVLISRDGDATAPWLPPGQAVPPEHVRRAAGKLDASPHDVAHRLIALGHALTYTPQPDDAVIVSQNADGRAPWLGTSGPGHVLLTAKVLGRTPADITDRLAELGHEGRPLPEPDGFDDEDLLVLSEGLDSRAPWLAWGTTPSMRHVLSAARLTGSSPQAVGERLTRLGLTVHVPPTVALDDLDIVEAITRYEGERMEIENVLEIVRKTGRSPAEVAARLPALGHDVPDADYPTRRPAPTPPRRP
ncbi:hypothetical protein [Streptomyces sp. NPDC059894]|uniref:wHTH domain-containing protein n=1 Tax=unclassified Streptomyces TaxID=2593676 RepID=UPI0036544F13